MASRNRPAHAKAQVVDSGVRLIAEHCAFRKRRRRRSADVVRENGGATNPLGLGSAGWLPISANFPDAETI